MKKNLLLVGAVLAGAYSYAQCEAVATLNEDFSDFTISQSNAFPQQCWSANGGMPMIYTAQTDDESNQYAVYYNLFTAGAEGFLVTPEISTIDGNHQLSFSTFKLAAPDGSVPEDEMTVQVGTLATAGDFANFTPVGEPFEVTGTEDTHSNIVIPASETQKFIAFKIIGAGQHNGIAVDNVVWDEIPVTCIAIAELDEDFNDFTPGFDPISENCWSANAGTPLVYIDGEEGNYYPTFYSAGAANTAGYLVSPEIVTLDGNYELSFDAFIVGDDPEVTVTLQPGTLASAADFNSFAPIGDVINLTGLPVTFEEIAVSSTTHKFIAFKLITNNAHGAAAIDNITLSEVSAGTNDIDKASFSFYPNPSTDKNINITFNDDVIAGNANVSVYTVTGAKVFETEIADAGTNAQQINLSSLSSGMYIVSFESGNYSASKKLVIK